MLEYRPAQHKVHCDADPDDHEPGAQGTGGSELLTHDAPAGHVRQDDEPAGAYVVAEHTWHTDDDDAPVDDELDPAGQGVGGDWPPAHQDPAGQTKPWAVVLPAGQKRPGLTKPAFPTHAVHVEDDEAPEVALKLPAGQLLQVETDDAPTAALNCPAAHAMGGNTPP